MNKKFNLQKFEKTNARLESRITITSSYSFGFPQKFYRDNNIDKYKYVVLFFDKKNKAVGLHFTNDEEEANKFTVIKNKSGYGGSIVARSFFKTYNLDPKEYKGRYEWTKQEVPGMGEVFVIELKKKKESG